MTTEGCARRTDLFAALKVGEYVFALIWMWPLIIRHLLIDSRCARHAWLRQTSHTTGCVRGRPPTGAPCHGVRDGLKCRVGRYYRLGGSAEADRRHELTHANGKRGLCPENRISHFSFVAQLKLRVPCMMWPGFSVVSQIQQRTNQASIDLNYYLESIGADMAMQSAP